MKVVIHSENPNINSLLFRKELSEFNIVGQNFVTHRGSYFKVVSVSPITEQYRKVVVEHIYVADHEYPSTHFSLSEFLKNIEKGEFALVSDPLLMQSLIESVENGTLDASIFLQPKGDLSESRELMVTDKRLLVIHKADLESRVSLMRQLNKLVNAKLHTELEARRKVLENYMADMNVMEKEFQKKIERIMKVISMIEIYLGIGEELYQITKGESMPIDEPISIRQRVLYMDEEMAVSHYDADYKNVEQFDNWLLDEKNLNQVLPEKKGIVIFKPRRSDKHYGGENPFEDSLKNNANKWHTYFLIRNGGNLYRIFTENIVMGSLFFPLQKDIEKVFEAENTGLNSENLTWYYKRNSLLIQGLIEQREGVNQVFAPCLPELNIFKMPEMFNLIADAEPSLSDGKQRFVDWKKEINSQIDFGSRIVFNSFKLSGYGFKTRLFRHYEDDYSVPSYPNDGIYVIEKRFESSAEHAYSEESLSLILADCQKNGWKTTVEKSSQTFGMFSSNNWKTIEEAEAAIERYKDKAFGIFAEKYSWNSVKNLHGEISHTEVTEYRLKGYYYYVTIEKPIFAFRYVPENRYGEDSKRGVYVKVYPSDNVLNHDLIWSGDIEYYLQSRIDRQDYILMIPILLTTLKELKAEEEAEKPFAELVKAELFKSGKQIISNKNVFLAIKWWKNKNMIKRNIAKDDAKALRMIIKYLKSIT